jgi:5-(carboxyamino)imidazole ribonucleotide synthase
MLGDECAAITTEFENIPAETLEYLETLCPVRPSPAAVHIAQDRILEKRFIRDHGLDTAKFATIEDTGDLEKALNELRAPLLLKTASLGYDGKGQLPVNTLDEAFEAFEQLGGKPCILEELQDLECEVSVILARSVDGQTAVYTVGENQHVNGILDTTIVPARIDDALAESAVGMATRLAETLDYCGVLAVEFFVTRDGKLLINEMAPRPHNSGHYTVDASVTSQFEQQVRTMCGLPPGDTCLLSAVVMVNLLGDIWAKGEPAWEAVLREPQACLHLYGKHEARKGRKMGHVNCLADDTDSALMIARKIRSALSS